MPLEASANSQDLITVSDIRHNTLILKNGGLVQVLMVAGTNFALKPEDEQNILTAAYQNFLNSLGFSLQIIIHSRKVNIQRYLATLQKREAEEISPLLQNQIAEYREFIASFVKENPIMTKTFFVAVPYHPTSLTKKPRGSLKNLLPWPGKKKTGGGGNGSTKQRNGGGARKKSSPAASTSTPRDPRSGRGRSLGQTFNQ